MSNKNSFFDKALDFVLDSVSDLADNTKAKDIYEEGKNKVAELGSLAKTMMAISADREELRRTFIEIGKLCYDQCKNNPDECFAPLFDKVNMLKSSIDEKQLMVDTIKSTIAPKDTSNAVDADVESIDVLDFGKKSDEE